MKKLISSLLGLTVSFVLAGSALATPSTQIWNPSTDIQATGTVHLGIDNYFTADDGSSGGYAFPTDVGLTYGALPGLEIGIDSVLPQPNLGTSSLLANAKYGIPENGLIPALSVGGFNFGSHGLDQNVVYGVAAKAFTFGRLSAGYFVGNEKALVDPSGNKDNAGVILTWDKQITDKLWACVDYAGTKSALGATFYGGSWNFASNTSLLVAYGTYNSGAKPTITTQMDINI
jgi:hypothetical protein